ncbi:hypothetical protein B0H13DRAFT_2061333 [Mycena leptocephala]|nr:hypothetical protein B0H13DRAFT_2061333 [Mycena leptocephala]
MNRNLRLKTSISGALKGAPKSRISLKFGRRTSGRSSADRPQTIRRSSAEGSVPCSNFAVFLIFASLDRFLANEFTGRGRFGIMTKKGRNFVVQEALFLVDTDVFTVDEHENFDLIDVHLRQEENPGPAPPNHTFSVSFLWFTRPATSLTSSPMHRSSLSLPPALHRLPCPCTTVLRRLSRPAVQQRPLKGLAGTLVVLPRPLTDRTPTAHQPITTGTTGHHYSHR